MNGPTTRKWCSFAALHNVHDVRWILSTTTLSTLCINGRSGGSEWPHCNNNEVFESLAQPRRRPLEHCVKRHSLSHGRGANINMVFT